MKNRKGVPLMALGLLLIVAALLLVVYNTWESNTAGNASENALVAIESARFAQKVEGPSATETPEVILTAAPTAMATSTPTATAASTSTATGTPTAEVTDAAASATAEPTATATAEPTATPEPTPTMEPIVTPEPLPIWERVPGYAMPVVEIDGLEYVGTLTIPALELKLPVQETWSYKNLKTSPCVYHGTCYKDGFVIIAHRYNTHFSGLKDLRQGDPVTFTDMEGNVFRYEVLSVETLQPHQVKELLDDQYAMSLMTCNYDGSRRVTVRLKRR